MFVVKTPEGRTLGGVEVLTEAVQLADNFWAGPRGHTVKVFEVWETKLVAALTLAPDGGIDIIEPVPPTPATPVIAQLAAEDLAETDDADAD